MVETQEELEEGRAGGVEAVGVADAGADVVVEAQDGAPLVADAGVQVQRPAGVVVGRQVRQRQVDVQAELEASRRRVVATHLVRHVVAAAGSRTPSDRGLSHFGTDRKTLIKIRRKKIQIGNS